MGLSPPGSASRRPNGARDYGRRAPVLSASWVLIQPPRYTGKAPGEPRGLFERVICEWRLLPPSLVAEVHYDHFTAAAPFDSGETRRPVLGLPRPTAEQAFHDLAL